MMNSGHKNKKFTVTSYHVEKPEHNEAVNYFFDFLIILNFFIFLIFLIIYY